MEEGKRPHLVSFAGGLSLIVAQVFQVLQLLSYVYEVDTRPGQAELVPQQEPQPRQAPSHELHPLPRLRIDPPPWRALRAPRAPPERTRTGGRPKIVSGDGTPFEGHTVAGRP